MTLLRLAGVLAAIAAVLLLANMVLAFSKDNVLAAVIGARRFVGFIGWWVRRQ